MATVENQKQIESLKYQIQSVESMIENANKELKKINFSRLKKQSALKTVYFFEDVLKSLQYALVVRELDFLTMENNSRIEHVYLGRVFVQHLNSTNPNEYEYNGKTYSNLSELIKLIEDESI